MSSDLPESQTINPKSVALISNGSYLPNQLLAKLIDEKLKVDCKLTSSSDEVEPECLLVLIDCGAATVDELSDVIKNLHDRIGEVTSALFNVEHASEHEQLLEWPSVYGIFYRDTDQEQLIRGLERLLDGDYWVPRKLLHHYLDKNRRAPAESLKTLDIKLTKREKQILRLIKDGATNASISGELDLSEHTVKSHLYNVYKKIGVKNRLEASNWVRDIDGI